MSAPVSDEQYQLVHAYCDGELDPINMKAVEQQIADDPKLAAERDRILALRRALHEALPPQALPSGLRRKVESTVGPAPRRTLSTWNAIAASLTAAIFLAAVAAWYVVGRSDGDPFMRELTASHARALIAARVTDVNSSDQHAIKPWFSTRTAQAPRIVDLSSQGFALVGGRLDLIAKIPVPTLVYGYREHFISLTEMPATASGGVSPGQHTTHGFHIIGWTDGDTAFWATSDIGAADLENFVRKFQSAAAEHQR
jgi:anti-sigma factor RsiW